MEGASEGNKDVGGFVGGGVFATGPPESVHVSKTDGWAEGSTAGIGVGFELR